MARVFGSQSGVSVWQHTLSVRHHHLAPSDHQHFLLRADQNLGIQTDTNRSLLCSRNKEYNHTPSL